MAQVLALVDDLFFQAKMMETARLVGVELRACSTTDALLAEVAKQAPKLVVVDLNVRSDALGAIARLRAAAQDVPLVAYLSHVQTELAQQARRILESIAKNGVSAALWRRWPRWP